jgi:hypothetical protein
MVMRRRMPTVVFEHDYDRVKLLFEYTKFHIGVYLTLASIILGILGLKPPTSVSASMTLLIAGAVLFAIAGMAGGIIVSRLTQVTTYNEFWQKKTGPFWWDWLPGQCWTYIEHTSFWLGFASLAAAFLFPCFRI